LEHYYRAKAATGDTAAGAEAIYHANHLDWARGVQEWCEVFKTALDHSDYEHCRVLLAVRNILTVGTEVKLGEVSLCEGEYFLHLAQYEKARQEFTEAITAYDRALEQAPDNDEARHNKGLALLKLGEVQAFLSQYPEALASY
jgi:tetratricopeptide (TPR) repeat protein